MGIDSVDLANADIVIQRCADNLVGQGRLQQRKLPFRNTIVKHKNATLDDIARHAGVSYQTVSRVLNGNAELCAQSDGPAAGRQAGLYPGAHYRLARVPCAVANRFRH
ncbi:LacI family DNA-binding transcriptional regulator [Sodalis-like symbiont of Bactericera trigonica]|nr:LacI family DNA-binding transcriptional regulator [Sodalis-like symbiont of Bactericera trigonica]